MSDKPPKSSKPSDHIDDKASEKKALNPDVAEKSQTDAKGKQEIEETNEDASSGSLGFDKGITAIRFQIVEEGETIASKDVKSKTPEKIEEDSQGLSAELEAIRNTGSEEESGLAQNIQEMRAKAKELGVGIEAIDTIAQEKFSKAKQISDNQSIQFDRGKFKAVNADLIAKNEVENDLPFEFQKKERHSDKTDFKDSKDSENKFLSGALRPIDLEKLKYLEKIEPNPIKKEQLDKIREEVNHYGEEPSSAIERAMRDNDVVIIGEMHAEPNTTGYYSANIINALVKSGAELLAIESHVRNNPALEEFNKTGKFSDSLRQALGLDARPGYEQILLNAHKAGLSVVAVDCNERNEPKTADRITERNKFVHKSMSELLKEHKKVALWIGSMHTDDRPGVDNSVSELIGKTHSVSTLIAEEPSKLTPLPYLLSGLESPVMIPTKLAKQFGKLPSVYGSPYSEKYSNWDWVLAFPQSMNRRIRRK